jgi:hypothetical protein
MATIELYDWYDEYNGEQNTMKLKRERHYESAIPMKYYSCPQNVKLFLKKDNDNITEITYDCTTWENERNNLKEGQFFKLQYECEYDENRNIIRFISYIYKNENDEAMCDFIFVEYLRTYYDNSIIQKQEYNKCCSLQDEYVYFVVSYRNGIKEKFNAYEGDDEYGRHIVQIKFNDFGKITYINFSCIYPGWVRFDKFGHLNLEEYTQ